MNPLFDFHGALQIWSFETVITRARIELFLIFFYHFVGHVRIVGGRRTTFFNGNRIWARKMGLKKSLVVRPCVRPSVAEGLQYMPHS